jgi:hypothetical protein
VEKILAVLLWWKQLTSVDKASVGNVNILIITCEDLFEREREAWVSTSMQTKMMAADATASGAKMFGYEQKDDSDQAKNDMSYAL